MKILGNATVLKVLSILNICVAMAGLFVAISEENNFSALIWLVIILTQSLLLVSYVIRGRYAEF